MLAFVRENNTLGFFRWQFKAEMKNFQRAHHAGSYWVSNMYERNANLWGSQEKSQYPKTYFHITLNNNQEPTMSLIKLIYVKTIK